MNPAQPRQCVILAGGLGSRLGGAVSEKPKPMLEIAGEPFLRHLMREITRFGVFRFLILAGYRGGVIQEYFANREPDGDPHIIVDVLVEEEPMGTGGALLSVESRLDEKFLLCNGDSLCLADMNELCIPLEDGVLLRMALREVAENSRYGEVRIGGDRVVGFLPRPESGRKGLVNAGLYCMRRDLVRFIPQGKTSLEADVFPVLAAQGAISFYDVGSRYFIDIGIPCDLEKARIELPVVLQTSIQSGLL